MENGSESKELLKFKYDPKYREKVIIRNHKDQDKEYNQTIKAIEVEKNELQEKRGKEISRITNSRWTKYANGNFMVNHTEGKIKINQSSSAFSSIQGAELNMQMGARIVTEEHTKSKKHASIGGAALGAMVLGPVGAVAGGAGLAKTRSTGTTVSNQIPTCIHLGINVNIDGFINEIVLVPSQIDQSSKQFAKAQSEAQQIVALLGKLAKTPVPENFLQPHEEALIKNIDGKIASKESELQQAMENRPTYALPSTYRTEEQKEMSDEDYLIYLGKCDKERESEFKSNKELKRRQKQEIKNATKMERKSKNSNNETINNAKNVWDLICKVVFWIISVLLLLIAIISFTVPNGIISGIVFLITALLTNPLIVNVIKDKLFYLPIWACALIAVLGFIVGVITYPLDSNAKGTDSQMVTVENATIYVEM